MCRILKFLTLSTSSSSIRKKKKRPQYSIQFPSIWVHFNFHIGKTWVEIFPFGWSGKKKPLNQKRKYAIKAGFQIDLDVLVPASVSPAFIMQPSLPQIPQKTKEQKKWCHGCTSLQRHPDPCPDWGPCYSTHSSHLPLYYHLIYSSSWY